MTKEEINKELAKSTKAELIKLIFTLNDDILRLGKLVKTDKE